MAGAGVHVIEVRTTARETLVDITHEVGDAVARSGLTEGFAHVWCPHTTAGVTVNEGADPDVATDIAAALNRLVPPDGGYRHREGNADAHVKASLVGSGVLVPLSGGRLALGTWQAVFFCEFDGPRTRHVEVRFLGG